MQPVGGFAEDLERARAGDSDSFRRLVGDFAPLLKGVIRRNMGGALGARTEVEDLLQETLIRAFRSLAQFRGDDERSLQSWLSAIAVRSVLDSGRQKARNRVLEVPLEGGAGNSGDRSRLDGEATIEDGGASPSRVLRRGQRLDRLREALAGLSEDQRRVVELARLEGLPIKEVARRMDRTPNAVSMLLLRALQQLRRNFGNTESLHLPPEGLDLGRSEGDD